MMLFYYIIGPATNYLLQRLSGKNKNEMIELNEDFHVLIYKVGDAFPKHIDYFSNSDNPRIYTFGLLLNDDFEGGEFQLNTGNQNTPAILPARKGRSLLFPSFMCHRVTPVTKGKRRSLVVWCLGPKFS